ncbi:MAG: hypothetical protein ABF649_14715 [Bacillus sp. (in: firmicutes)]
METQYFKNIKIRWLVVWLLFSFFALCSFAIVNGERINEHILDSIIAIGLYVTIFVWLFVSFRNKGINLKRLLIGKAKNNITWAYFIFL